MLALTATLLSLAALPQTPEEQRRILEIRAKRDRGESLSEEDRAFVQPMMARRDQKGGPGGQRAAESQKWAKEHPPRPSTGLVPLTDLGTGLYQGQQRGLYPGGRNTPPVAHVEAGIQLARSIAPLDADGRKSAEGGIVLLSIGFSNPSMEFPPFQRLAAQDSVVNPRLTIVNGCVGGRASREQADPDSRYWKELDQRVTAAGVTARQVQALWIKEVIPGGSGFPDMARQLSNDLVATLQVARDRFPNARLAYLSSRAYGGFAEAAGSPEPGAYEGGFAVKWAIALQLSGDPQLNYDGARGAVRAPWAAWGPYLWTDGVKGRKDGFVYRREDLRPDGLHPSESGAAKIANLLLTFFKTDPTTRPWFLKSQE
jgi:hypothetical protein